MRMNWILLIVLAVISVNTTFAWKPAGDRIMTKWGEALKPENTWKEYPRPQLAREQWLNLNGLWEYAILPKKEAEPVTWQGEILVPFCVESALSGVGKTMTAADRIWYKRKISIPEQWAGKKIVLNFGAIDYESYVWINKTIVGSHKGGYDRFSIDITEYLKPGENDLVISASDPTNWEDIPAGKQRFKWGGIWYMPVSGIWQTVWLEPVSPDLSIEEVKITPNIDKSEIAVQVFTDNVLFGQDFGVRLTVTSKGKTVLSSISPINKDIVLKIPSQHLWSPEDPFLYDLKAEICKLEWPVKDEKEKSKEKEIVSAEPSVVGEPLDVVNSYFGMRKIALGEWKNNQPVMYLNNKQYFQNGVLDQGWWPDGLYTAPSEEAMVSDLIFLKDAGFNMLRKHVKVEPDRYYYNADKLGLLIWQDMPSAASCPKGTRCGQFTGPGATTDLIKKSAAAGQFEQEYRNIITMLYNHPSIICWVNFNEGWGQYNTGRLTDFVRDLDGSRLVNAVSGWALLDYGDIYDIHTYDAIPAAPTKSNNRAIVVGEYGGIGYPVKDHTWNVNAGGWGYQQYDNPEKLEEAYRIKFNEIIRQQKELGISGAVYTQTTDVQGEVNGLLTYDRKVTKIPTKKLKQIHQQLLK